ncbi:type 2 periplasmic-binding domain-containing protein [Streptococcus pneumoniae]|uniref:transporter substrate-binding domain-containing protein n=1 Tax=Streptococcus pneumoniae TaxID=1313 RepID=UPI0005EA0D21|nr:transporter substrate-binding domain-containing protein [Streptococcus pneumoniae]CJV38364.1 amino acid ABC transporter periplasmic amino acid-binding protein [Streptococcus pneumoniae]
MIRKLIIFLLMLPLFVLWLELHVLVNNLLLNLESPLDFVISMSLAFCSLILSKIVLDILYALKDLLQNSSLVSLPKNGNLITDLKSGQVDAVIFEEPVAKGFVENNPDLAIADLNFEKEQDDSYAVAMKKDSKELKEAVDKTIQKLKESGELDKLIEDAFKASIEK